MDLTCPESRGPIWEERQGRIVEYRCRAGHAYSPSAFLKDHRDTVERTLWSPAVALEESANISESLHPNSVRKPQTTLAKDGLNWRRSRECSAMAGKNSRGPHPSSGWLAFFRLK